MCLICLISIFFHDLYESTVQEDGCCNNSGTICIPSEMKKNLLLTHLCFADDSMVFAGGTKRSMEGVISVFNEFARYSWLKISLENSSLFMVGISQNTSDQILLNFSFEVGLLHVRHLGLPSMTEGIKSHDYLPLRKSNEGL